MAQTTKRCGEASMQECPQNLDPSAAWLGAGVKRWSCHWSLDPDPDLRLPYSVPLCPPVKSRALPVFMSLFVWRDDDDDDVIATSSQGLYKD